MFALSVISLGGVLALGASAQNPNRNTDRPPQKQQAPAPRTNSVPPRSNSNRDNVNRPQARNAEPQAGHSSNTPANRAADRPADRQFDRPMNRSFDRNENRPPSATMGPGRSNNLNSRPNENVPGARLRPRQEIGAGAPRPFVDKMRDLTPRDRERVLQSSKAFQNLAPEQQNRIKQQFNQWDRLSPTQRADLRSKENTWRRMTPEQRGYVKNDVLPRWRQIPWQRQQVIQQKLGVLQNMPESARNRRLSDPNFTYGMSDEDRATLHELSHLHVGGAPDPPGNE